MLPFLSFNGPVLAGTELRRLEAFRFMGGGLNSIRNADFFFPLESDAPLVLTDGLDLFTACAEVSMQGLAITARQRLHRTTARSVTEQFQWRNYRSLKAFCLAFKIGFSR